MKYNIWGYDAEGYNRKGFNKQGFDRNGYNKDGFDRDGYDSLGRDAHGFDRNGFDVEGYDRDGFHYNTGLGREGYARDGYDLEGYDRNGFDMQGWDRNGYDENGFDHDGLNRYGVDCYGLEKYNLSPLETFYINNCGFCSAIIENEENLAGIVNPLLRKYTKDDTLSIDLLKSNCCTYLEGCYIRDEANQYRYVDLYFSSDLLLLRDPEKEPAIYDKTQGASMEEYPAWHRWDNYIFRSLYSCYGDCNLKLLNRYCTGKERKLYGLCPTWENICFSINTQKQADREIDEWLEQGIDVTWEVNILNPVSKSEIFTFYTNDCTKEAINTKISEDYNSYLYAVHVSEERRKEHRQEKRWENEHKHLLQALEKEKKAAIAKERAEKRRKTIALKKAQSALTKSTEKMTGAEFEVFIAHLFQKLGYKAEVTKLSGDQGVDVIAERDGIRIGIQAKCYSEPVGNAAVQEVIAGTSFYKLDKGFVVTNSSFTPAAKRLAEEARVALWDKNVLIEKCKECGISIE